MNGLNTHKLDLHETAQYIRSFDIALLTETRCDSLDLFTGFQQFWLPVPQLGKADRGVCVLVHPKHAGLATLWRSQPDTQAVWVRLRASMLGLDKDLFVAAVYIPPAGSAQLQQRSLASRMHDLRQSALLAEQQGYVLLGGDFNAKVSTLLDVVDDDAQQSIQDSGLPCDRGSSSPRVNLHGQLLIDFCHNASLLLGTGRLPGDGSAQATHSSGSRLDHFLMDFATLAHAHRSWVVPHRHDSDHKPLVISFPASAAASAAALSPPAGSPGQTLPKLFWDGSKQEKYVGHLRKSLPALGNCQSLVRDGQCEQAFHKLGDVLQHAAISAGCKFTPTSRPRKGSFRDKPYFDDECRRIRAEFRWAAQHDPDSMRVLARRFKRTIRRKCRQYRQRQTPLLLRHLVSKYKCFWTQFNSKQGALPDALSSQSAWQQFHQNLCAPPTTPRQPPAPCPPPAGLDTAELETPITQAEVQKALPKLANGKAVAQAGWPAELLRYSSFFLEDENGNRRKVWVLAPLLTDLLNAFFLHGGIPSCVSSGLVTPIHKKGCAMDPTNYRPIAVGEPLYRLYTTILNDRLVKWTEAGGLRSPAQAGFRPRKSTIHHLFALRHFIDHALNTGRPLYVCFVDLQKAYDTVQHDLLWERLRSIGVSPRMLAAIQSLYTSGTLSMKVDGTAGQPAVQRMGVRQGCPLSPTLFGIFFDGLHDHLHTAALAAGLQLRSGRSVSSLVYADDVALLSWSPQGLQQLIDGMQDFCQHMGLTISPTKTEVVVLQYGSVCCLSHVARWQHPSSHLAVLQVSGPDLSRVWQYDACLEKASPEWQWGSVLSAKYKQLHCDKSFPMMRRLFDAIVKPTVSYGCEIWGTLCSGASLPELSKMGALQLAFFRQLCKLRRSVSASVIFAELAEVPWLRVWWTQVLSFMHRLSKMSEGSLHADILKDNIHDAEHSPLVANWAGGIRKQFADLGMASPYLGGVVGTVDVLAFRKAMMSKEMSVWQGLL